MTIEDRRGMINELLKKESIEDRFEMIDNLFNEKSTAPAKIRVRQVGSVKLVTKEQLQKRLWQFSAEERKEIILEAFGKTHERPRKAGTPVQI